MRDVTIVQTACAEVLDNPRLKEFLVDIVLAFGASPIPFTAVACAIVHIMVADVADAIVTLRTAGVFVRLISSSI